MKHPYSSEHLDPSYFKRHKRQHDDTLLSPKIMDISDEPSASTDPREPQPFNQNSFQNLMEGTVQIIMVKQVNFISSKLLPNGLLPTDSSQLASPFNPT